MITIWKSNGDTHHDGIERGESLWAAANVTNQRKELQGDISTEVAVIGGGMAGILTAYLLQQQGISVIVVECKEIGSGITRNTTAKITSQHRLIYQKLVKYKGEERARGYAMANQMAIQKYDEIRQVLSIDCDYEVLPSYIYTLDNETRINQELEAARKVGLPASITRETSLPFPVKAALRFEQQAQFHPIKFLNGVAKHLTIYEHINVTALQSDGLIITDKGNIKAKSVVIATHYPFINRPGYYFFRLHQERDYLSALEGCTKVGSQLLDGMYLDMDPQGFTFRTYKNYLLLGGCAHRAGEHNPLDAYAKIERAAEQWYPEAKIKYAWSAQDCITPDSIPYIGRYSANHPNIYVATGFNKWGMTSSMVSAKIISDMIGKKENEYQKVFHPRRLMFSGTRVFLKDAGIVTVKLLSEHLKITHEKLSEIERNQAGVIKHDGQKVGVYRDNRDVYYFVTTKCPHLGCSLEWNQNELTWDCPCHGSRFDYHGNLITSPAMRDAFNTCKIRKKTKVKE